jgi:hypothetical protein
MFLGAKKLYLIDIYRLSFATYKEASSYEGLCSIPTETLSTTLHFFTNTLISIMHEARNSGWIIVLEEIRNE